MPGGSSARVYPKAFPLISQIANAAELPALETMVVELSNEVDGNQELDEFPGKPITVVRQPVQAEINEYNL